MDRIGSRHPARLYLREWREHFGLTQDQLADRMDTSKGQISKLETARQRWNQHWIERVAAALGVEPHRLLVHPEAPTPDEIMSQTAATERQAAALLSGLSADEKNVAITILEGYVKAVRRAP